jgi:hypothetical protein
MRRIVALLMLVSLIGCQSLQGVIDEGGVGLAAGGSSVLDGTPYVYDVRGNVVVKDHEDACAVVMGWDGAQFGHTSVRLEPPVDGVYGGTYGGIAVTLHEDGRYLSWSVPNDPWLIDMNAIVVKGGSGYRVYAYRQRADDGGDWIPHEDAWLRAPLNRRGKAPEIGHVTFCYWDEGLTYPPEIVWRRRTWDHTGASSIAERAEDGLIAVAGETWDADYTVSGSYVAFLDPDGGVRRYWEFGSDQSDLINEIEFDADGRLLVVGTTHGQMFPDLGIPHVGGADVFVMKLDPDGDVVWAQQYGTVNDDRGHGLAVDGNGDVLVVGDGGADDARIAMHLSRFDRDGARVWTVELALADARVSGVGVGARDGNAYVVGTTTGDLQDVQDHLQAVHLGARHGGYDPYAAKFQPDGTLEWTYQFGTAADDGARAVALDNCAHLRVAGMTMGNLMPDGSNLGGADLFVVRISTDGEEIWRTQFGSAADDHLHFSRHVASPLEPEGQSVLVGTTYGDFAGDGAHIGEGDVFVVRLDHDGQEMWRRQYGTEAWDFGHAVAFATDGTLLVAGSADGHSFVLRLRP